MKSHLLALDQGTSSSRSIVFDAQGHGHELTRFDVLDAHGLATAAGRVADRIEQAQTVIDDHVMGGVSQSWLGHDPKGCAVFEGEVSVERNGGFASARSSPGKRDQEGAQPCLIELRGNNSQVRLSFLTSQTGASN